MSETKELNLTLLSCADKLTITTDVIGKSLALFEFLYKAHMDAKPVKLRDTIYRIPYCRREYDSFSKCMRAEFDLEVFVEPKAP